MPIGHQVEDVAGHHGADCPILDGQMGGVGQQQWEGPPAAGIVHQTLEHGGGDVSADQSHSSLVQGQGNPAGTDTDLEADPSVF